MKTIFLSLLIIFLFNEGYAQKYKKDASLIVNDPKLLQIIAKDVKIEILSEGHEWTEGPVWLPSEDKLLFSDIPVNSIFEWTEKGGVKLYLKPSGYTGTKPLNGEPGSNGLLLNQNRRTGSLPAWQQADGQNEFRFKTSKT